MAARCGARWKVMLSRSSGNLGVDVTPVAGVHPAFVSKVHWSCPGASVKDSKKETRGGTAGLQG